MYATSEKQFSEKIAAKQSKVTAEITINNGRATKQNAPVRVRNTWGVLVSGQYRTVHQIRNSEVYVSRNWSVKKCEDRYIPRVLLLIIELVLELKN